MLTAKKTISILTALLTALAIAACGGGGGAADTGGNTEPTALQVSSLSLSSGTDTISLSPAFAQDTTAYAATVANDITDIDVDAVTDPADATVTITGNAGLHVGANFVEVRITSGSDVRIYTIVVSREKSASATLVESLTLTAGGSPLVLVPAFDDDVYAYSTEVTDETSIVVTAETEPDGAAITVTGDTDLEPGDNLVTVVVASGDEPLTYQIRVNRKVTPLEITELNISAGGSPVELSPSLVNTTTVYTASVANSVTSVDITASFSPAGAVVTGTGTLALAEGNNSALVTATFNDQSAQYRVFVYRAHDYSDEDGSGGPYDTDEIALTGLEIERTSNGDDWPVTVSPSFARENYVYTATVPAGTTSVTLSLSKQDSLVYNSNCEVIVNGTPQSYSGTVTVSGLVAGLNTIDIVLNRRQSLISSTIVATRTYRLYLTVSGQTFDCTDCAVSNYTYPACTSTEAPECAGNYAMNQQTFREYDYMMGMKYVDGQVNICDDFTDFLKGSMYGYGGVIPATGKIIDSGADSDIEYFTVEWYDYSECYQKAYDSLDGLLGLIGGLLPDYFDVGNVMNFDFYGYSRMQVVGILNSADFPGLPTDDSSTSDVNENVVGQFCIIHLADMPTRSAAEAVPFFETNADIAAAVSYYARYNPEDLTTTGTPPAGYENIRKIYFLTPR